MTDHHQRAIVEASEGRRPAQGTVVYAKFGPDYWTGEWELAASGISRAPGHHGEFRWWIVGSGRAFGPEAVERWVVLGDRDDHSWLRADIAAALEPHWTTRPEYLAARA